MNIINCRNDIAALPPEEKAIWLDRLAATIHRYDAEGSIITSTADIAGFGYTLEDFPNAPIAPYVEPVAPPAPQARNISKLSIRRQIREWGKESAFDAALDAVPHARADWSDAQELMTNDPLFTTNKEPLKALLGISEEQFENLLSL